MLKREQKALSTILGDLRRVRAYLHSDRTAVCAVSDYATNTTQYVRHPANPTGPLALTPMNRDYGSDLCLLDNAIKALEHTLFPPLPSGVVS